MTVAHDSRLQLHELTSKGKVPPIRYIFIRQGGWVKDCSKERDRKGRSSSTFAVYQVPILIFEIYKTTRQCKQSMKIIFDLKMWIDRKQQFHVTSKIRPPPLPNPKIKASHMQFYNSRVIFPIYILVVKIIMPRNCELILKLNTNVRSKLAVLP